MVREHASAFQQLLGHHLTVWEVSEILKADFSPTRGILFDYYTADTSLAVMFQDGRVAALRFGHNGNCLDYRE